MPRFVLLDEFHLDFFVPPELRPAEIRAIRRTLAKVRFAANLRRAIRDLLQRYPSAGCAARQKFFPWNYPTSIGTATASP